MKKTWLRLSLAFFLAVGASGIPTTKTASAQCGCSCSALCNGTCDVSCFDCGIYERIEVAIRCCQQQEKNLECDDAPGQGAQ